MKISSLEGKRCMTYKTIKQLVIENAVYVKRTILSTFQSHLKLIQKNVPQPRRRGEGWKRGEWE